MHASSPTVWGPKTWEMLHLITLKPNQPIQTYQAFLSSLSFVLPCKKCQRNYSEHLKQLPIPNTKRQLANWLIQIHNRVNQTIHKEQVNPQQILTHWQQVYQTKHSLLEILLPVMYYLIKTHPGYYKMTPEIKKAHELIWLNLPQFFSHFPDSTLLTTYLSNHPPPILFKEKYFTWFKQLHQDFHREMPKMVPMKCDVVCRI